MQTSVVLVSSVYFFEPPKFTRIDQSNIMISDDDTPLIMDAGLSLIISRSEFTVASMHGPCRWQAPEVLDPEEEMMEPEACPYTPMSDVYSLAMTILQVWTGKPPFSHRRNDTVVILDIIRGNRPFRPGGISDDLWGLLQSCWIREPEKRPTACVVERWLETTQCLEEAQLLFSP
jgi:serine/threonine protein kinase